MRLCEKLARWIIFSVLLALLPIVLNYLRILTRSGNPTMDIILSNGELLLIAAGISAAALGGLIGSGKELLVAKIFAGGGSLLVLALASLYFADIAATPANQSLDIGVIANASKYFFLFSVIAGAGCVALEEF